MTNVVVFEGKKSTNDFINNDTMSDDEEVASGVPPRYLLSFLFPLSSVSFFPKRFRLNGISFPLQKHPGKVNSGETLEGERMHFQSLPAVTLRCS